MGNDVEDDTVRAPAMPKEHVKQTTSSKKADVPPPSADPARARKNKKPVTGNEAALKNKTNNKSTPGPASTPAKHEKKSNDRHSRSGKADTKKKVRQGWGDDKKELDYETKAEADATAELEAEASEKAAAPAGKSLQEYLAEKAQAPVVGGTKPIRQANEGAEDKWSGEKIEKEQVAFIEGQSSKKIRQKPVKEKKFLDFNAVFSDNAHGNSRRDAKKPGFKGKPAAKASALDEKNFPSL